MSFLKHLFLFLLVHFTTASPQINLYFTDWVSNKPSNVVLQDNCLYIAVPIEKESNSHQIISYCLSESATLWNIQINNFNQRFTFAELYKKQITTEQLYLWSTPIDIIEHYQLFLNELSTSMTTQFFYNCTLPRFGPFCQYEFNFYRSDYSSLKEMIHNYYLESRSQLNTLTCYIHLPCNRGPAPACLDWSEICDGKIDCLNDGVDEEYCWQLEMNECNENEYRCANGQCIPFTFFRDNHLIPDCLDGSDEIEEKDQSNDDCSTIEPTFGCEDVTCTVYRSAKYHQYKTLLTSSCEKERNNLLSQAMFPNESKSVSRNCWLAFKCIVHMPIPQDPACRNFCQNKACEKLIENSCPDILFVPDVPVLFGNIYFAYTKNHSKYSDRVDSPPYYICFSHKFCNELFNNKEFVIFKNTTCARPYDLSLVFSISTGRSWLNKYILPMSNIFSKCNVIIKNTSTLCNRSNMYRCINSSKCISIYRLRDGILDCHHYDDENIIMANNTSLSNVFKTHFKCIQANTYISYHLVMNGQCDCNEHDDNFCEDENLDIHYIRKHISFQTICDGFTELLPITIDGQNHTDETECEQWLCNNTYTRCDGIWHCRNGADEINCDSSALINCPSYHHICVSVQTNQPTCLPIEKANDGNIDCLGATDEPKLCRSSYDESQLENFYCNKNNTQPCIQYQNLCDGYNNCDNGDDEQPCDINRNFTTYEGICHEKHALIRSDLEKILCRRLDDVNEQRIVYFSLDTYKNSIKQEKNPILPSSSTINHNQRYCHRGLDLLVWLDDKNNITNQTCLCPASYYGDQCQYQNERISLTIQFLALSDSWQIPFLINLFLIDDSNERIIHSYEQLTYLSMKDCQKKFHHYLIYSNRPKDRSRNYAIHIDIYEQISLAYRGSFLIPIDFSFLPVYRLSLQLTIPRHNEAVETCSADQCIHGKCMKYIGYNNNETFCQCEQGWTGKYCTIPYNCMCSLDSLCIGISSNNHRSICLCPMHKFGSRCLLKNSVCQLNGNNPCFNNGQCIPLDQHLFILNETFICICPKGFSGKRCEIIDSQILLSFHEDMIVSQSILIHFIEILENSSPKRSTTFKTISAYQDPIVIYWSHPFHLVFIQQFDKTLYLAVLQKNSNQSMTISKRIQSSNRCQHINEIFNSSVVQLHLLRRIKYYHIPCQKSFSLNLTCFYDDIHICLCDYFGEQRQTNCFEFDHQMKLDCLGQNGCENDAQCFQDNPTCPQTSICVCSTCFYGRRCQFSTNGFSLFLDAILGYHIQPYIPLMHQPITVQISLALTIIMTIAGFLNGISLMITFKNKKLHEVGSGIYLFVSSIFTLLSMGLFALKFSILLEAQMKGIDDRSFLYFQCVSIDFFLRISLHMDHWLHACVGCERAFTAIKATSFNKRKSRKAAKYIIFILLILMIMTTLHDPIHRRLINDEDEHGENERIWCVVSYSPGFQIFNYTVNIIHSFGPFFINLISAIIIIKSAARQRAIVQPQHTHRQHLHNQLQNHSRLLIAPILLVILAFPHLIITFASGCMKSTENSWLFITGYFISFIPSLVTFFLFVFPSKLYREEFNKSIKKYKTDIQQLLASLR